MDVERIKFERTGGFAGIRIAADLDLKDLSDEQVHTLMGLLEEVGFSKLPEHLQISPPMPDEFTYSITVESEEWHHTVTTADSSASERLQDLLEILTRLARNKMRHN